MYRLVDKSPRAELTKWSKQTRIVRLVTSFASNSTTTPKAQNTLFLRFSEGFYRKAEGLFWSAVGFTPTPKKLTTIRPYGQFFERASARFKSSNQAAIHVHQNPTHSNPAKSLQILRILRRKRQGKSLPIQPTTIYRLPKGSPR